jgi:uncharacterized protein
LGNLFLRTSLRFKKEDLTPIICTGVILIVSFIFNAYTLSSPERMQMFNYVMLIPAPIAFLFFWWESGSFFSVVRPIIKIPNLKSLTFAVLFPVMFLGILTSIVLILGLGVFDAEATPKIVAQLPKGKGLVFALCLLVGEEFAWRGYLLPRFTKIWGPIGATVAIGIIWAIWHGPIVYGLASFLATGSNPLLLTALQMSAVFVLSFPFAYAYFESGSIVPPVIMHFLWNWLNPAILGNVYRNKPGVIDGNLLLINGETTGGVILGLFFVYWFVRRAEKLKALGT